MNQELFTVVIPLYNKATEIERTLKSVLNQSISCFRIIVVDDGSTDGSAEIVKKYTSDNRITLIQQKNMGVSSARNRGIQEAGTNLIALLDADDEWYPDFLETTLELYYKYPDAGIYGTAFDRCADDVCKPNTVSGLPNNKKWDGYIPSYFRVCRKSGHPPFSSSCVVLNKEIAGELVYFNTNAWMSEDLEVWDRIAFNYPVVFTTKSCARYHLVASNKTIYKFRELRMLPSVEYFETLAPDVIKNYQYHKDLELYLEYLKLIVAYFNIGAGNKKYAQKILRQSHSLIYVPRKFVLNILAHTPNKIGKLGVYIYSQLPIYRLKIVKKLTFWK